MYTLIIYTLLPSQYITQSTYTNQPTRYSWGN